MLTYRSTDKSRDPQTYSPQIELLFYTLLHITDNLTTVYHLSDGIPREVIRWEMRKLGVEEQLVSAVMSIYTGAKTVVTTVYGNSNGFGVKVGKHQCSALSPLLFVIVMEALSRKFRDFRVALQWEFLYADDLVVIAETEDDLVKRLNEWKDN